MCIRTLSSNKGQQRKPQIRSQHIGQIGGLKIEKNAAK